MKKAIIQLIVLPVLFAAGMVINAVFPPAKTDGQRIQKESDSSKLSLQEAILLIGVAEQNAATVTAMEQISKKETPLVKRKSRKQKQVPVQKHSNAPPVAAVASVPNTKFSNDERPAKVVIVYLPPPTYGGTRAREPTDREIKEHKGLIYKIFKKKK